MKKTIPAIALAVLVLGVASISKADTAELNLFNLGCPTTFDHNSQYWTSDFDLGVTFTKITDVYIDWSGEITAGLAVRNSDPCNPFPLDVAISTYLDVPIHAAASIWGGQDTYPAPESFECQSDFLLWGTWSGLLDGRATIWLYYETSLAGDGHFIKSGSIILDRATLVVEGVIPEPSSLCLIGLGWLWMTRKSRKHRFY